jgi:hypothetical protein
MQQNYTTIDQGISRSSSSENLHVFRKISLLAKFPKSQFHEILQNLFELLAE